MTLRRFASSWTLDRCNSSWSFRREQVRSSPQLLHYFRACFCPRRAFDLHRFFCCEHNTTSLQQDKIQNPCSCMQNSIRMNDSSNGNKPSLFIVWPGSARRQVRTP
jgi:hypothetical protein